MGNSFLIMHTDDEGYDYPSIWDNIHYDSKQKAIDAVLSYLIEKEYREGYDRSKLDYPRMQQLLLRSLHGFSIIEINSEEGIHLQDDKEKIINMLETAKIKVDELDKKWNESKLQDKKEKLCNLQKEIEELEGGA